MDVRQIVGDDADAKTFIVRADGVKHTVVVKGSCHLLVNVASNDVTEQLMVMMRDPEGSPNRKYAEAIIDGWIEAASDGIIKPALYNYFRQSSSIFSNSMVMAARSATVKDARGGERYFTVVILEGDSQGSAYHKSGTGIANGLAKSDFTWDLLVKLVTNAEAEPIMKNEKSLNLLAEHKAKLDNIFYTPYACKQVFDQATLLENVSPDLLLLLTDDGSKCEECITMVGHHVIQPEAPKKNLVDDKSSTIIPIKEEPMTMIKTENIKMIKEIDLAGFNPKKVREYCCSCYNIDGYHTLDDVFRDHGLWTHVLKRTPIKKEQ